MPDNLESLCDLVEIRAVQHCTPLAQLWKRVFAVIRDGQLGFGFPDEFEREYGGRNPSPYHVKYTREILCVSALSAIENCDAFPPWTQLWVRRMLVSAVAFDKALFPADQKQPVGRKSVAEPVADFLRKKFPNGPPPHLLNKQIARMAEDAIGMKVSTKTVTRAKKLLSDGTK
jgi:hypothetical protein